MICQQEQNTDNINEVAGLDIFEYLKSELGVTYISDLPENKHLVFRALQRLNLEEIGIKQLDDLTQYVFQCTFEELNNYIKECKEV